MDPSVVNADQKGCQLCNQYKSQPITDIFYKSKCWPGRRTRIVVIALFLFFFIFPPFNWDRLNFTHCKFKSYSLCHLLEIPEPSIFCSTLLSSNGHVWGSPSGCQTATKQPSSSDGMRVTTGISFLLL